MHHHQTYFDRETTFITRLTITLSHPRSWALKETAPVRGKTIGQLIDESLDFYGVKSLNDASELVRRARAANGLSQQQITESAVDDVQHMRRLQ